ncbi:ADM_HP2_G0042310.mRNA.1.CDS.1 [Saccharomyces cerevisiae]|nr:ADM_HP2_G0042310.mRNA.1.CDS.1 [Saccharomyces cerevisiae]CAI6635776.1 ADM_HP2_G0042310.mRNA.1.CDS.1 [Saccharomyces cerevisiae]
MENTMPNATFQISMADNTTTAQMHPNRKPSQIAYDASFSNSAKGSQPLFDKSQNMYHALDPPLVEPLASSVSNNDNETQGQIPQPS